MLVIGVGLGFMKAQSIIGTQKLRSAQGIDMYTTDISEAQNLAHKFDQAIVS